jgi:membrane protease YdiL (CAAX protease family)
MDDIVRRFDRPFTFFAIASAVPCSCWLAAGALSHIEPQTAMLSLGVSVLGTLGLAAFFLAGAGLALRRRELRADLIRRLFNFGQVPSLQWIAAAGLMPASILSAMAVSLLFGYSAGQFQLARETSFTSGVFPTWFLLVAAPVIEELGWHTYGIDSLRSRYSLLTSSVIFAIYWAIWHMPLAAIKDYYQSHLIQNGLLAAINFPLSIIPFVIIMNWIYYKSARNIAVTALFHVTAGLFNEIFHTHPDSKFIQTVLLGLTAILLVKREPALFLRRNSDAGGTHSASEEAYKTP